MNTVVTPVYLDLGDARPSFYVASRGHHADIGGSTPGSMPPFSQTIAEEGVLFDNFSQMSILDWIRAGNAGSYGTVVEPCNYTEKFTDPAFVAALAFFALGSIVTLAIAPVLILESQRRSS